MFARLRSAPIQVGQALCALALAVLWLPTAPAAAQQAAGPQTNVASYRLDARLDPDAKQVHGTGRVTYTNPSPDTLSEVWLHLYLNAFRSLDTPWMREAGAEFRGPRYDPNAPGWISVESLTLADTGEPLALPDGGDTAQTTVRVPLPRPLPPGQTLTLDAQWTSQLPRVFARTGFSDTFFMVGQWYPKLAVYDRGRWDTEPWHAYAEFFHDFGDYDLSVTVPRTYQTGASGVRQADTANPDGTHTVTYHAERVTDVAWTAWPDFATVTRRVDVAGAPLEVEWLAPASELPRVERHLAVAQGALDRYSRWYGHYPWPKLTIVVPPPGAEGAGGMEYPSLVTTSGSPDLPFGLGDAVRDMEVTTAHEIAHQWFPMQVQSNEGAQPWLDEGFADYLTIRSLREMLGPDQGVLDLPFAHLGYEDLQRLQLSPGLRQPLASAAWQVPSYAVYGSAIYGKGSLALLSLERTLGDDRFTAALHAYADRWRWRHPTIPDLRQALEESTGERLGWFFDAFVNGGAVAEYRVASVDATRATVERVGDAAVPVQVQVTYADGSQQVQAWDGASPSLAVAGEGGRAIQDVVLDPDDRLTLEPRRLDDAHTAPDDGSALALSNRWLGLVQALLQLLGQVG